MLRIISFCNDAEHCNDAHDATIQFPSNNESLINESRNMFPEIKLERIQVKGMRR